MHRGVRCPSPHLSQRVEHRAELERPNREIIIHTDTFGIDNSEGHPTSFSSSQRRRTGTGQPLWRSQGPCTKWPISPLTLDDYEDNTEFDENEITIKVTGLKAVTCNYAQIQAAIMKALQETPETYQDQRVYRLEDPTRWYLTTFEEKANKLHQNST